MKFETRLDVAPFITAVSQMHSKLGDTKRLMRMIGPGLVANTQDRMDRGVDPQGQAWTPLNPIYAADKRGPGILRERPASGLQGSLTFRADGATVRVGSNKIYAAVHQFGATIKAKTGKGLVFKMGGQWQRRQSVTIPARPYRGDGSEDVQTVADAIHVWMKLAVSNG